MQEFVQNETSPEVRFLAYCVEIYKLKKGISGAQTAALFTEHRIWEYICQNYGALHTTGSDYTFDDIDGIIASKS